MATKYSIQQINAEFEKEFSILAAKFERTTLDMTSVDAATGPKTAKPGVYVYWNPNYGVIKVGRSLDNSLKRALEHIRDNTKGGKPELEMKTLMGDKNTQLLLFNSVNKDDLHWPAALEIFFERKLNPYIPSDRLG
jgi:hypothetical protein